jgi:5-enolpyruvylshikimate-3-phosphate synthase
MSMSRTALIAALLAEDHLHPELKDEAVYSDDAQTAINYVRRLGPDTEYPGRLIAGLDTFPDD